MTSPLPRPVALALRVAAGAGLACFTLAALISSALSLLAKVAALAVMAVTLASPIAGLVVTIALAPAGLLLAPPPARVDELLVSAFLTAWMFAVWRPLGRGGRPRAVLMPAALYAVCAATSWIAYTVSGAAGTEPLFVPAVVARAIPLDHLVFSSPEAETFTLLPLLYGLAIFSAAMIVGHNEPKARRAIATAIVISAAVLSAITMADVVRQWGSMNYGSWFLLRYLRGERFSLHLPDLNAAGSQYVLGLLTAIALAIGDRPRRALWAACGALIVPALWISGSRSASIGALVVGGSLIALRRRAASIRVRPRHALVVVVAAALVLAAALIVAAGPSEQGTASNALRLRWQFLVTSARMFASAPILGVGIGHYHERSNEFMPEALRRLYGYENAHNYFAQQFAELGIVGGIVFVWMVIAVLRAGWRAARSTEDQNHVAIGLLAGSCGYLLTCVTGHPLLVPEAAIPFWGAFGALAALARIASPTDSPAAAGRGVVRWAAIAVVIIASAHVALAVRRYSLSQTPPAERGFYEVEKGDDARSFVWMTRHGVFYIGPQPGTVTVPVRAPDFLKTSEPFLVSVEIGGRRVGVYQAAPDRWTTIEVPLRRPAATPFRRIDLRANRSWSPMRDRGWRIDDQPRSVMVGEARWATAGGR